MMFKRKFKTLVPPEGGADNHDNNSHEADAALLLSGL
jgi:hypothetical protein